MFHVIVFPKNSLNRLVLVCLSSHFLITMREIDTAAEEYLELHHRNWHGSKYTLGYRYFKEVYLIL